MLLLTAMLGAIILATSATDSEEPAILVEDTISDKKESEEQNIASAAVASCEYESCVALGLFIVVFALFGLFAYYL